MRGEQCSLFEGCSSQRPEEPERQLFRLDGQLEALAGSQTGTYGIHVYPTGKSYLISSISFHSSLVLPNMTQLYEMLLLSFLTPLHEAAHRHR
jgi:hypothetical protein